MRDRAGRVPGERARVQHLRLHGLRRREVGQEVPAGGNQGAKERCEFELLPNLGIRN